MIMGITIIMGITRITIITIHPISMDITGGTVIMGIMTIGIIMVGATLAEATMEEVIQEEDTLEEVTLEEVTTGNQDDFELMNVK